MLAIAQLERKYQSVEKLLNGILIIFGWAAVAHAAYSLITDFSSFASLSTVTEFVLPPIMSLLFLPFLFLVSLYVHYENAFARIRFGIPDPALISYARRRVILAFHVRTELLKRWTRNLAVSRPANRQDVDRAIREVKRIRARERDPKAVPLSRGWSPFEAGDFLASEGLATGDYHRGVGDGEEWWASSPYLEIGDAIMPNNLAYYVYGNEAAATTLKLALNVNTPENEQDARRKLREAAGNLYEKALGDGMPDEVANHLHAGTDLHSQARGKQVVVSKELWPGHRTGGYTITFAIKNSIVSEASVPVNGAGYR